MAKIVAPPMPCLARKAISIPGERAMPQRSEAVVKIARPAAKTMRRPKGSAGKQQRGELVRPLTEALPIVAALARGGS